MSMVAKGLEGLLAKMYEDANEMKERIEVLTEERDSAREGLEEWADLAMCYWKEIDGLKAQISENQKRINDLIDVDTKNRKIIENLKDLIKCLESSK